MSTMAIAGICAACGVALMAFGFVLLIVIVIAMISRRSQKKGVSFSDGINKDEWAIVREAAAEVAKSDEVIAALQTVKDLVSKTLVQKQKA